MKDTNKLEKQVAIRQSRSKNLVLRNETGIVPDEAKIGEVVSIVGKDVIVETEIDGKKIELNCVLTGTIISKSKYANLIAAGDIVYFIYEHNQHYKEIPEQIRYDRIGKIIKVEDRKTKLSRVNPANRNREQTIAANIDTLLIFVSAFDPILNTRFIDRYLVAAKLSNITPIICINKKDLCSNTNIKQIKQVIHQYEKLNIDVHFISVIKNIGINKIKTKILNKKTIISGASGAGKSSFLNAILGYEAQKVKEISERTNKGIHTTSFSKRYKLFNNSEEKGWIIDTPGLREFGIWDLSKEEIGVIFPDFLDYYLQCKYTSCTHTHEPDCAVIDAINDGKIDVERYNSYLNIYDSLED